MDCPRCGGLLQERTRVGVVVDTCDRCRGIWLDRGEIEKIVAVLHAHERERASTEEVAMQCPRCVARLVQARQAGIPVDRCPRCGGTWLDRGELARISARQWQLRHEWIPEGERSRPSIRWGRPVRSPRRRPGRAETPR